MAGPEAGGTPGVAALLASARRACAEAAGCADAAQRYATAHLAALRAAAAVLASRARPAAPGSRPASVWTLLARVAPELAEWASYFDAGTAKRAAAQRRGAGAVTDREADDLVRAVQTFLGKAHRVAGAR